MYVKKVYFAVCNTFEHARIFVYYCIPLCVHWYSWQFQSHQHIWWASGVWWNSPWARGAGRRTRNTWGAHTQCTLRDGHLRVPTLEISTEKRYLIWTVNIYDYIKKNFWYLFIYVPWYLFMLSQGVKWLWCFAKKLIR